jgi:hypothetical protein
MSTKISKHGCYHLSLSKKAILKDKILTRTVASNKFWSSMSFQNLVRLLQIYKISLLDHAHVNKLSKKLQKKNDNQCHTT